MLEKISNKFIIFKFSFNKNGASAEVNTNVTVSQKRLNEIALLLAREIAKSEGFTNQTLIKEEDK